jgi:thiaminase/transcriptional activator TenA
VPADDALWTAATRHAFLDGVRDGTLPVAALDTWLAQDAVFVGDLLAFQARLLARAPRSDQAVLAGGAVALVEELEWFERLAAARGLDLAAAPLPATLAYRDLLQRLDAAPYADALGCLEVVERVYLEAWRLGAARRPGVRRPRRALDDPRLRGVRRRAGRSGGAAGPPDEALVADVLRQEAAFWSMAVDA